MSGRVMSSRGCVAGFAAVVGIWSLLLPFESSARGGLATFHMVGVPPFLGAAPGMIKQPGAHAHGAQFFQHYRYGRFFPLGGIGGYFGAYPVNYFGITGLVLETAAADITATLPPSTVPPRRRECLSQIYRVPSEQGGERAVTVTRC